MKPEPKDAMDDNEVDWELPTEAEMKVIRARRERSDKISSLMGEYLLKGYKMLSSICRACDTILMQDKHGNLYCVACAEIDSSEMAKDDPTLSETAARRQAQESQFLENSASCNKDDLMIGPFGLPITGTTQSTPSISQNKSQGGLMTSSSSSTTQACLSSLGGPSGEEEDCVSEDHNYNTSAEESKMNEDVNMCNVELQSPDTSHEQCHQHSRIEIVLREKIDWACRLLKNSKNTHRCIELSNLIKSCAESLAAIKSVESTEKNVK